MRYVITKKRSTVLRWIAHAYLTGEAGQFLSVGNGIDPAEVEVSFLKANIPALTASLLGGMADAGLIQPLYASEGPIVECSHGNIAAVILNDPAINWLVKKGFIPSKFAAALGDVADARDATLEAGQFQDWLKLDYQGPEAEIVAPVGLPATVAKTSQWVSRLAYTPEEAEAETALIEASSLAKGSKAAFKAHVARRTVEAVA